MVTILQEQLSRRWLLFRGGGKQSFFTQNVITKAGVWPRDLNTAPLSRRAMDLYSRHLTRAKALVLCVIQGTSDKINPCADAGLGTKRVRNG